MNRSSKAKSQSKGPNRPKSFIDLSGTIQWATYFINCTEVWLCQSSWSLSAWASSPMNEIGRDTVQRYIPKKFDRNLRRTAHVRMLTGQSCQRKQLAVLSSHLLSYFSHEWTQSRSCPKVHTSLPSWAAIREESHPGEQYPGLAGQNN